MVNVLYTELVYNMVNLSYVYDAVSLYVLVEEHIAS